MAELKPCPFCGAIQTERPEQDGVGIYQTGENSGWPVEYRIWCEPCGAEMAGSSRDWVIEAWNTRAALSGISEVVDALEWFAGLARYLPADMDDAEFCDQDEVVLQAGHLRRAAAALSRYREGES